MSRSVLSVKTLQRFMGKYVSLSIAVPGALLFTREMNHAISKALRTSRPVKMYQALREEISHWFFLETWDDPLPWREERHTRVSLASDASASGWGGLVLSFPTTHVTDYWTVAEQGLDISTREALALNRVLLSHFDSLGNTQVDALVDNQTVVQRGTVKVVGVSVSMQL